VLDDVVLAISDDGIGIDDDEGRRSGLRNMAERAQALGGTFDVRRGGELGGTVVTWRVPRRTASR
jgi:signal transduction histidine kinase